MRIAYLINKYPAVSHSFIRREIREMEDLGAEIRRVTIRPATGVLPDEHDVREQSLTVSILGQGVLPLIASALSYVLRHPRRSARAVAVALRMSGGNPRAIFRHLAYFVEACWLARFLREEKIDHVHAHFGTNPAAVARITSYLCDVPYSFTAHGPDEFDNPLALHLRGKIADAAAAVAISSYGRSQLLRWSDPIDWAKVKVVRCGVDSAFLDSPVSAPSTEPNLSCVARLSPQKGLPLLIDACAVLKSRGLSFHLNLVGDGELRGTLEAQVACLRLTEQISFHGALDAAGVRLSLARSRAFVLPSFAEGLPVVLMEALALGRPVICTRIAGIPELVDEECGWLVPAGSVEALAEAMQQALEAPAERLTRMGLAGRSRVSVVHDARRNAAELLELISSSKRSPVT